MLKIKSTITIIPKLYYMKTKITIKIPQIFQVTVWRKFLSFLIIMKVTKMPKNSF